MTDGEISPEQAARIELNKARVALSRVNKLVGSYVTGIVAGEMTVDDLDAVDDLSDMTEEVDAGLSETRQIFESLGAAVLAFREQTETPTLGSDEVTDSPSQAAASKASTWIRPQTPPPSSPNRTSTEQPAEIITQGEPTEFRSSKFEVTDAELRDSIVRTVKTSGAGGAKPKSPLNEIIRRTFRVGDVTQVPMGIRKNVADRIRRIVDAESSLRLEVTYKRVGRGKTRKPRRIDMIYLTDEG